MEKETLTLGMYLGALSIHPLYTHTNSIVCNLHKNLVPVYHCNAFKFSVHITLGTECDDMPGLDEATQELEGDAGGMGSECGETTDTSIDMSTKEQGTFIHMTYSWYNAL